MMFKKIIVHSKAYGDDYSLSEDEQKQVDYVNFKDRIFWNTLNDEESNLFGKNFVLNNDKKSIV